MTHDARIDLILATLDHSNAVDQRMNTLWVGSGAMCRLHSILGIKYPGDIRGELEKLRDCKGSSVTVSKVNTAFKYLSSYMIDMGVFEEYFRAPKQEVPSFEHFAHSFGARLKKKGTKGQWRGKVVGFYSTDITPEGYAIESSHEKGSVQIYPKAALELWPDVSIEEQMAEQTAALWAAGGDYCTERGAIFQLVPINPTNAMYEAAVDSKLESCTGVRFKEMWQAILKSTPILPCARPKVRNSAMPIDEYLDDYEYVTDELTYQPREQEKLLIIDAVKGWEAAR